MGESHSADTKLQGSELLQQRLNDPLVAKGIARLLDRIESVSFAVEAVEGLVARGEVIIDSITDALTNFETLKTTSGQIWFVKLPSLSKLAPSWRLLHKQSTPMNCSDPKFSND